MAIFVNDVFENYGDVDYDDLLDCIDDWVYTKKLSRKAISELIYVYKRAIRLIDDELDVNYLQFDIENPEKGACLSEEVRDELIKRGMLYKPAEVDDYITSWFEDNGIDMPEELWVLEDYCPSRE